MSLKAFHILFIAVSCLLFIGLAGLAIRHFSLSGTGIYLVWAGLALAFAAGLVLYGVRFLRKLQAVSYL